MDQVALHNCILGICLNISTFHCWIVQGRSRIQKDSWQGQEEALIGCDKERKFNDGLWCLQATGL